jgi:hypothetical protein
MWSHYGQNHRRISLEFVVRKGTEFGGAKKVEYCSHYPVFLPHKIEGERAIEALLVKAQCWDYEREYRIIGAIPARNAAPISRL